MSTCQNLGFRLLEQRRRRFYAAGGFTTITDSFAAADGTPLAGRTTDTGGKVWTALVGTFQILGNQAAPSSGAGAT